MRIYIMTDLEGVAGVLDHENWCRPESRYNDLAKELLTREVNAAVDGFFGAGAKEILVSDGHGSGGIRPELLDPRVELLRGWADRWPLGLEEGWDFVAWVGQHAKARTELAHQAHTQGFMYLDLSINGISVGEFGQLAMCASQLGIRSIFGAGDLAFTKEAQALVPGIGAVAVKRGNRPGRCDELSASEYAKRNLGAIHKHPETVRQMIRISAQEALERAQKEDFGIVPLEPPFTRQTIFRQDGDQPRRYSIEEHPSDVAALMNLPLDLRPVESDEQLQELLARSSDSASA